MEHIAVLGLASNVMQFVEATQKSTNLLKGAGPFWGIVRFSELDATTEELIKFNRAMDQLVAYILEEHRGMISRDVIDDITKMVTVCRRSCKVSKMSEYNSQEKRVDSSRAETTGDSEDINTVT
jgi:hypothetical protein